MRAVTTAADAASAVCDLLTPNPAWPLPMQPVAMWRDRAGGFTVGRFVSEEPAGAQLLGVLSAPITAAHVERLVRARPQ